MQSRGTKPAGFIDAVMVGVSYLEGQGQQGAVTSTQAVAASERMQQAAKQATGEVLPSGGDQKSKDRKSITESAIDTQHERARKGGVSYDTQKKLDKLARHRPDLLAQVQAGELSVNHACIQAGYVKALTPLQATQGINLSSRSYVSAPARATW